MATITAIKPFTLPAAAVMTPIALGLSNTLTYNGSAKQILLIQNASGASITATLDGSGAPDTVPVPGAGANFNSAAGAVFTIPAGAILAIPLSTYRAFLKGNITLVLSLATTINAWLLEV